MARFRPGNLLRRRETIPIRLPPRLPIERNSHKEPRFPAFHVADSHEPVACTHPFQLRLEKLPGRYTLEVGPPLVATKCDEVQVARLLVTMEPLWSLEMSVRQRASGFGGGAHIPPGLKSETWGTRLRMATEEDK